MNRKAQLRTVVLDIICKREPATYAPTQFASLVANVAEVLARQAGQSKGSVWQNPSPDLNEGDKMLVSEIFWDLVVEKVITIGLDSANQGYPWFRLHSEFSSKT